MPNRRLVIYQVLAVLGLVLALELAARLASTFQAAPSHSSAGDDGGVIVMHPSLGWDRRPNFKGPGECFTHREFDAQGLVSVNGDQLRNEGAKQRRAIFVGDSNTYGICLLTEATFVEVADRLLPDFSLINLGVAGYTSYQGYKQLLKYGPLTKPDAVFISFNYNDRRYVPPRSPPDGDAAFAKAVPERTTLLLEYSYLFRAVRRVSRALGIVRQPVSANPAMPTRAGVDKLEPRVDPLSYKANLIKMVTWARQNGSTPYLILLGDGPNRAEVLRRAKRHLDRKDYEAAIRDLNLQLARPRSYLGDIARRYLSIAYRETGRPDEADRVLVTDLSISLAGGRPIFEDVVYQDIMREVARELDVQLIDAYSKLIEVPRVYFDESNHFDAEGHEIVAKLISDVLSKAD